MKEQRVYMIDTTFDDLDIPKFDDKRTNNIFMEISEKQGNVYSLGGFTKAFNRGEINSNTDIIRIIYKPNKMKDKYLFTAYCYYEWDRKTDLQDCQTMILFYSNRVVAILTDKENSKKQTMTYEEFAKDFAHINLYDIEIDY